MTTRKWQKFERLVAAIHVAEQTGAEVKWNDTIKGRQFDVTIRFRNGFYEYLTVIECKDHKKPVSVEMVDALVTKSRDVGANKAIMVSASGYQEGSAFDVAQKHNIHLLTLKVINATSAQILTGQLTPMLHVYDFRLRQEKIKRDLAFPEEPGILRSLMRGYSINGPNVHAVPEDFVKQYGVDLRKNATIEPQIFQVEFPPGTTMTHPNTLERSEVSSFLFQYRLVFPKDLDEAKRLLDLGLGSDPYLTSSVYELKDEISQTNVQIDLSRLDFGFDTILEPGKYYANPQMGFSYYCDGVDGSIGTMYLVESYQAGRLIQAVFFQDLEYSRQYIEITDQEEIDRLSALLEHMRQT